MSDTVDRADKGWRLARNECLRLISVHIEELYDQELDSIEDRLAGRGTDRSDEFRHKRQALEALRATMEIMGRGKMVLGLYAPSVIRLADG